MRTESWSGGPQGVVGRIQNALRVSEERFRRIIDDMQEFVVVTDADGRIVMVNPSTVSLLGYASAEELLGTDAGTMLCDSSEECQQLRAKLALAGTLSGEMVMFRRKDGSRLVVEANFCMVRGKDGKTVRMECVGRDMTERRRSEDELRRAKEAAEASTQAKSEFLANMSHELRTPLNAIIGLAHLLETSGLNGRQRELLGKLSSSADGLVALIGDLLDFSKIEAGKVDIEKAEFEVETVLANVANTLATRAKDKGLEINTAISPQVPKVVLGDALRLGQVLLNLAGNAVKFTAAGKVTVGVEIAARVGGTAFLRFVVRDTGPGIEGGDQRRVFEPFVQGDGSVTRRHGGAGLGLAISKQLVGLMGGALSLDSEMGQGSTFSFTIRVGLPASAEDESPPPVESQLRVLAVDDSFTGREVLRAHLQAMAHEVHAVGSGTEALRELAAASSPYDLVLLDWYMPDMDGPEVAQKIKASMGPTKAPHIVMVTGNEEEGAAEEMRALGVDGFISKPIAESELRDKIESLFGATACEQARVAKGDVVERESPTMSSMLTGRRILIVEDNEINQEVAKGILTGFGADTVVAENGQRAVEILARDSGFDAVLMDLQMPVMDGIAAAKVIRAQAMTAGLPIIALTADAVVSQRARCFEVGMDEFLTKPLQPRRLHETLERMLAGRPHRLAAPVQPSPPPPAPSPVERPEVQPLADALPGLDTRAALSRLMGNRGLYLRLLRTFAGEHREDVARIREALERGDTVAARAVAHKLKGVAGNLSATQVFAVAARVESLLRESQLDPIGPQLDELAASMKMVSASIEMLPPLSSEPVRAAAL